MKRLIKKLLRENSDIELSSDDFKKIEREAKEIYQKQEEEKENIFAILKGIENLNKDKNIPKELIEKLVIEKKQKLSYLNKSYEDILKYVTQSYKDFLKRQKAYQEYEKERQEKIKKGLTKENIIDIFVTALEGGSNYWYYIPNLPKNVTANSEKIGEHILNGGYVQFKDIENPDELLGYVEMDKLLEAITLLKKDYPDVYEKIVSEEADADDADIFLQLAVMGEVVFG